MGERWNERVSVSLNHSQSELKERGCVGCTVAFAGAVSYLLFQTLPESHVLVIQWSVSLSGRWMALNPANTDPLITAKPEVTWSAAITHAALQACKYCCLWGLLSRLPLVHSDIPHTDTFQPCHFNTELVPIFMTHSNRHSLRRTILCQTPLFFS